MFSNFFFLRAQIHMKRKRLVNDLISHEGSHAICHGSCPKVERKDADFVPIVRTYEGVATNFRTESIIKCTFSIDISLVFFRKIGALLELTSLSRLYIGQLLFLNFRDVLKKDALITAISFLETRRNHERPN
jgi:hypothetical protein